MSDLDGLLDYAFAVSALEDGVKPARLTWKSPALATVLAQTRPAKRQKNTPWTESENEFLRQNYSRMSEGGIAAALGRSCNAVHIHSERHLGLPRPTKDPRWITANKMAISLGVDNHKTTAWCKRGLLRAELVPTDSDRVIWRIRRQEFVRFALDPMSWVWFDPDQVPDPGLRRLIAKRKARWGDEWWSTRQVADYHGVDVKDVTRYIKMGRLQAVQTHDMGGRSKAGWATWHALRSEAVKVRITNPGKGIACVPLVDWSDGQDALILLGNAIGLPFAVIAHLSGAPDHRLTYRHQTLIQNGLAGEIIQRHGLQVDIKPDGRLWADWWIYQERFPCLARAMRNLASGDFSECIPRKVSVQTRRQRDLRLDMRIARGVIASWLRFHANTPDQAAYADRFCHASVSARKMEEGLRVLQSWGFDPMGLSS